MVSKMITDAFAPTLGNLGATDGAFVLADQNYLHSVDCFPPRRRPPAPAGRAARAPAPSAAGSARDLERVTGARNIATPGPTLWPRGAMPTAPRGRTRTLRRARRAGIAGRGCLRDPAGTRPPPSTHRAQQTGERRADAPEAGAGARPPPGPTAPPRPADAPHRPTPRPPIAPPPPTERQFTPDARALPHRARLSCMSRQGLAGRAQLPCDACRCGCTPPPGARR